MSFARRVPLDGLFAELLAQRGALVDRGKLVKALDGFGLGLSVIVLRAGLLLAALAAVEPDAPHNAGAWAQRLEALCKLASLHLSRHRHASGPVQRCRQMPGAEKQRVAECLPGLQNLLSSSRKNTALL